MPTKKPTTASNWVDPDDAPDLDRDWFNRAELREGDRLIRAAQPDPRPPTAPPQQTVNLRLDTEVLTFFRAAGRGWQARINAALRKIAGL